MLHEYAGAESQGKLGGERCKPDYESMIDSARKRLKKTTDFLEAVFSYTGRNLVRGTLAELIGELESERRSHEYNIENLIKRQEEDAMKEGGDATI